MMAINQFDRVTAKEVIRRAEAALAPLAEEFGLTLTPKGSSYDDTVLRLRVELGIRQLADGRSSDQAQFEKYCVIYGLSPKEFGREFDYCKDRYKIVAVQPSRDKRPIVGARTRDGKRFLFEPEQVQNALGLSATAAGDRLRDYVRTR